MTAELANPLTRLLLSMEHLQARWRERLGVSAYEMLVLTNVEPGSATIGDLGRRVALTSGAMTGLIDRLVKAKLVERVPDTVDRRKVLVQLTDAARLQIRELRAEWTQLLAGAEQGVDVEERRAFAALLARVTTINEDLASDLGRRP